MTHRDIGFLIKQISVRMQAYADADLAEYDLTLSQARVLSYLAHKGGEAMQKDIEEFMQVAHPTVVGLVSRLTKNGFLTWRMDEKDRRNKIISMTPKARAVRSEMERHRTAIEERILRDISPEARGALREILVQIFHNLE